MTGERPLAAIWMELRRLAYLIAELADRVDRIEHDDD